MTERDVTGAWRAAPAVLGCAGLVQRRSWPVVECDWLAAEEGGDHFTCAQVLRLTAAQADASLMPNSAASCR